MIKSNLQAIKRDALSTVARIDTFLDYLDLPESDAELQRAADQHEQETACAWDNVSSPDFDGCNGCKYACALGRFPNRSAGD